MDVGLIIAIAYAVIAIIVFLVVIPKVSPHESRYFGPHEEEDTFVIAFCIGLFWLPALLLVAGVDLLKIILKQQRNRRNRRPKHRASH